MKNVLKTYAPLLFIAGVVVLTGGLAVAYIAYSFTVLAIALTSAGGLLCAASLFFLSDFLRHVLSSWRGTGSLPRIGIFFLLLAAISGLNYAAARFDVRWDLTAAQQHTLSGATQDLLRTLDKKVTITVFYVGVPPKYIEDILNEYARLSSGMITTEIVDPLVQLGYASQFDAVFTGNEKRAVIQCGSERQDVDFKDTALTEPFLTNAIIKATREKRRIYFLSGHGEYDIDDVATLGLSVFNRLLENNNSETKKLMLGVEKQVPDDCDLLVVAGPRDPLTLAENDAIQQYLKKGGEALFLVESRPVGTADNPLSEDDKLKNPALNEILNYWGVRIGDDVVVDLESHAGDDVGSPATKNYPPHDRIVKNLDYTFYVRPRSMTKIEPGVAGVKVAPLVYTASTKNSWAETDALLRVRFDESADVPGPVAIAAIIWEPANEQKNDDTKIIVVTDADFLSNSFIGQYSNAQFALNCVGWLTELQNVVPIPDEAAQENIARLNLTSQQVRLIAVVLCAMPAVIALMGIAVWWRQMQR